MTSITLEQVAEHLRQIDICQFTTVTPDDVPTTRPMSNNRDVDYDGTTYFYTSDRQELVSHIEGNPQVALGYSNGSLFISISGQAELIRDQSVLEEHWVPELDKWFPQGARTPGIVMIKVAGQRIKYWQNEESGELVLDTATA